MSTIRCKTVKNVNILLQTNGGHLSTVRLVWMPIYLDLECTLKITFHWGARQRWFEISWQLGNWTISSLRSPDCSWRVTTNQRRPELNGYRIQTIRNLFDFLVVVWSGVQYKADQGSVHTSGPVSVWLGARRGHFTGERRGFSRPENTKC